MADSINTVGGNTNVNNERVIKSNKPQGEEAASRAQESDNGVRSVDVELSDEIRQAEEPFVCWAALSPQDHAVLCSD